jgi:DNA helicase-2/ATP-dependent DNA helicase PcrA
MIPAMSLDELNTAQRAAVETLGGPLLVLAGAGSGKTRVVTYRIANLIRHRTPPERILAVTFTNKAAAEMQQRITALLGRQLKQRPVVSTFHAHCVQILRRHITRLGYPARFSIYDRGEQEGVARSVLREIRVDSHMLRPGDLLAQISRWKNRSIGARQAAAEARNDRQHLAAVGYRRYQETLRTRGAVDFDDLLLCTVELFRKCGEVVDEESGRFDHLLIDEYQDTNDSQYRIVRHLAARHRNLCVVGDDDQSIYGWRGAEVQHILGFTRDWPDAKVVRLVENYRSTAAILEMANRLIAFNRQRHAKVLRAARQGGERPRIEQFPDETAEARGVVADIQRCLAQGRWEPRDIAILFRTNEQPRAFETELRRSQLPYVLLGGMSFFDRREVRDVLAYLKVLVAPDDETSLLRIMNTPPRGISKATVGALMEVAVAQGCSLWQSMQQAGQRGLLKGQAAESVQHLAQFVEQFRSRLATPSLVVVIRDLLARIDYEGHLRRVYDDPNEQQSRWAAVEEVINALAGYEAATKRPTLQGFLDEVVLDDQDFDRDKEKQLQRNAIVLMTLHSAKGLEFPHVYLVGLEEGLLPHRRSLDEDEATVEEERRLCYVGVTRAQQRLTLSLALTRRKWGKPRETQPSRFLFELIGQADHPAAAQRGPAPAPRGAGPRGQAAPRRPPSPERAPVRRTRHRRSE